MHGAEATMPPWDDSLWDEEGLPFRHPVRTRRRRSGAAAPALLLLAAVVGGAFAVAPLPPRLEVYPFGRPERVTTRVHPLTPVQVAAAVAREGHVGLFCVAPDGEVVWLFPRTPVEAALWVRGGRREYLPPPGLALGRIGTWLFVHLLADRPLTAGPQELLRRRVWETLVRRRNFAALLRGLRRTFRSVLWLKVRCDPTAPLLQP